VPADHLSFISAFKGRCLPIHTDAVFFKDVSNLGEEHTRPLMDELHKYIINLCTINLGYDGHHNVPVRFIYWFY
jgi:hypothetical protein